MIAELKSLQEENLRLKKMDAEVQLQREILQVAISHGKKVVKPFLPTRDGKNGKEEHGLSAELACAAFSVSESCYR